MNSISRGCHYISHSGKQCQFKPFNLRVCISWPDSLNANVWRKGIQQLSQVHSFCLNCMRSFKKQLDNEMWTNNGASGVSFL